jgi:hypothetical protein
LPRRLGDDPLARAKGKAPVATDAASQSQVTVQSSRSSYNDVFFQRRGGYDEAISAPRPESPEISEISELPEIRDAAAAQAVEAVPEPAIEFHTEAAAPVTFNEEIVAKLNASAPPPAVTGASDQQADAPTVSQAPEAKDDPAPQKNGGFFKRLFGKFK